MITKRFIKSSIIYTVAGALPVANAVLLLPLYLLYLPAQEYGSVVIYLSFSILVQIAVTFSFDASLFLYFHEYKKEPQKLATLVSSSFTFMLLLGTAVGLVLLFTGGFIFEYFYHGRNLAFYPYGIFSVLTGVFQSIFKVNNTFLQGREKPILFLRSNLLSFFLVAGLTFGGLVLFPNTLIGPIGGRMVAFVVSGCWALYRIYTEFGMRFDLRLLRTTFAFNTYQFIYQIQMWVINYFDRFLMVILLTMTDVGIYDSTIKCVMLLDFVIAGMFSSFFPKILSQAADQGLNGTTIEINRYYHGLTASVMLMVSGTILILPILIRLFVTKPGYSEAVDYVPYASLIFLLRGMKFYFGLPFNTMKYSKPLPVIFMIVASAKIIAGYFLIQKFGIYGAIVATLAAGGLEIVLVWLWMRSRFQYKFNAYKMIFGPVILLATVLVAEPMFHFSFGWQIHVGYVMLTAILLVWLYRKEIVLIDLRKMISG